MCHGNIEIKVKALYKSTKILMKNCEKMLIKLQMFLENDCVGEGY